MLKLPLGVDTEPITFGGVLTAQPLPAWVSENLPPGSIGDPRAFLRAARDIVEAVRRYAGFFP